MDITTVYLPEQIACFREIRKQWRAQLESNFFYAEGEQVFARLLKSNLEIRSVLLTPEFLKKYRSSLEPRTQTVWVAEKSWIEQNTWQKLNQGILALARIPDRLPLSNFVQKDLCRFVALNGIDHAVNVGSIFRNCAAFSVDAVIVDSETAHPYCWRAVKASLGAVFQVPVLVTADLCIELKFLQKSGMSLIAADPAGSITLSEIGSPDKICAIFGNEHRGISGKVLSLAQQHVSIPVSAKVDSLNVAAASAVFLYAIHHGVTENTEKELK